MSIVTNPIIDAVVGFFAEDTYAFDGHRFVTAIANGEGYATVGQLAVDFLDTQTTAFTDRMSGPHSPDPWGLTELLQGIVRAWPQEWLEPLGEALAGAFGK